MSAIYVNQTSPTKNTAVQVNPFLYTVDVNVEIRVLLVYIQ